MFWKSSIWNSARTLIFLTEGFHIFRHSLQSYAEIHQFRLQPFPSESFPVYFSLMILNSVLCNLYYQQRCLIRRNVQSSWMQLKLKVAAIRSVLQGSQRYKLRKEQFWRQQERHPCLYLSSQTYGSNTAHCLIERSQRFLLATQGTAAGWGITRFAFGLFGVALYEKLRLFLTVKLCQQQQQWFSRVALWLPLLYRNTCNTPS